MSDLEAGVDAPEDDLRAQLTAALAGETTAEPAQSEPEAPELVALDAQTAEQQAQAARDDKGRFSKKDEPKAPEAAKAPELAAPAAAAPVDPAADQSAAHRPPPGWSPASKAAFSSLPPEVQADVAKREAEVNQGFAKLAEYKGLEPLAELAKQNGTNIVKAVGEYRDFEVKLQNDFIGGVGFICQRFGVQPVALANAILARTGGAAHQSAAPGAGPTANQTASGLDLTPIMSKLSQLEGFVQSQQQREAQQRQSEISGQIEAFRSDPSNLYFENVRPQMARIMEAGLAGTLKEAYDAACWQTPEIRQLLINQQASGTSGQAIAARQAAAATQARQASKSVTGSPSAGVSTSKTPAQSLRAELEAQFAASSSRA